MVLCGKGSVFIADLQLMACLLYGTHPLKMSWLHPNTAMEGVYTQTQTSSVYLVGSLASCVRTIRISRGNVSRSGAKGSEHALCGICSAQAFPAISWLLRQGVVNHILPNYSR